LLEERRQARAGRRGNGRRKVNGHGHHKAG
jgi:hypothetical protein